MISSYSETQALKRPVNAKSTRVQEVHHFKTNKIMKKVYDSDLANLMGGATGIDCADLQKFANTDGHTFTDEQWDRWGDAYETHCMK